MALRKLRFVGDDILRKVSKPVAVFDKKLIDLVDDMFETMYDQGGCGLAAVQVGILKRVLVIDMSEDQSQPLEAVNPVIIHSEGVQEDWEGCLSIPGQRGRVERPAVTVFKALNRHGEEYEMRCEGRQAIALHHEIDHLNGVLYTDLALEIRQNSEEEEE